MCVPTIKCILRYMCTCVWLNYWSCFCVSQGGLLPHTSLGIVCKMKNPQAYGNVRLQVPMGFRKDKTCAKMWVPVQRASLVPHFIASNIPFFPCMYTGPKSINVHGIGGPFVESLRWLVEKTFFGMWGRVDGVSFRKRLECKTACGRKPLSLCVIVIQRLIGTWIVNFAWVSVGRTGYILAHSHRWGMWWWNRRWGNRTQFFTTYLNSYQCGWKHPTPTSVFGWQVPALLCKRGSILCKLHVKIRLQTFQWL